MLAKVIAWGPDRAVALARLGRALSQTIILGVETNLGFLQKLIALPEVVNADIDTELIERNQGLLVTTTTPIEAYAAYALTRFAEATPHGPIIDPWDVPSGLRVGGRAEPIFLKLLGSDEDPLEVRVAGTPTDAVLSFDNGEGLESSIRAIGDHSIVTADSVSHLTWTATGRSGMWVFIDGLAWLIHEETLSRRDQSTSDSDGEIRSPMPGRVVSLRVTSGDYVSAGQPLLVVEAMKMENILVAPDDGLVSILVREDDSVVVDEVVARLDKNFEKPKDEKSVETPSDVREKE
jgi:acetyl-CoA/propionyl-CoA carboxylase biotin carboxyl carrier protein